MGKNTSVVLTKAQQDFVQRQVAAGRYASVSEAVRAGLAALQERDAAVERWLQSDVAPVYDAMQADPDRGVEADEVFRSLRARPGRRGKASA